jgi:hypothetical protein
MVNLSNSRRRQGMAGRWVSVVAGAADDDGPHVPRERGEGHGAPLDGQSGATGGSLVTDLNALCERVARLSSADGAAVAVFAPSRSPELLHATDALAQQIDDLQFTLGEGPCVDAYTMVLPQLCPRLDTGRQLNRWPAFCDGAIELGVRAVFAFPLVAPRRALGVLELYRRTTGAMAPGQLESASVCASTIADTLMSNWASHLSGAIDAVAAIEAASSDPDAPLAAGNQFSRARVYIASGMVAVQLGISADEGLARLRAYTYAQGRSITDVAADIVAKRLSLRGFRDRKDG